MTILLTLLGAGLVVLLVWLSVVSWKSMRFKKESIENFQNQEFIARETEKKMDEDYNNLSIKIDKGNDDLYNKIDQIYTHIDEKQKDVNHSFEEVHNRIDLNFDDLHRDTINSIYMKIDEVHNSIRNQFDSTSSGVDSRFDKLHNLLNQRINELETKEFGYAKDPELPGGVKK